MPPSTSDAGADARSETPVNPRKRKKASRACDYCHLNHQPCDNGKPRCGVCEKHNKPCSYLRPTKRRGPQKGYRTALNTYKESAAAWGVVLGAIPGLDALIEGHLRSENGRFLLKSVKDPAQQDALIQKWQQSTVFKSFFPSSSTTASIEGEEAEEPRDSVLEMDPFPVPRGKPYAPKFSPSRTSRSSFGPADIDLTRRRRSVTAPQQPVIREPTSLSDIVAKDAARSSSHASQTLAPLGFAPNETIADFYDIGSNPEQILQPPDLDHELGTDAEQRVYYELLMGRSFDDSSQRT
ncbi:hypothetical protein QBC33DRAFT_578588 [Phialemonium atrogriseum]|uniref:Zn(2)-C6 fungal-type domain-containing protein n=1 Tax=Phialemonium atrogriseum TaxID=1093897 RepID=A0AAJ0BZL6_9PEZI|nr:uncharacterized protein QBC33DRAFT_578588 [Phialemonium atrogriseum]KAK1766757.1 hypothetical protein QBC33DRAFT_578588 [Phialemonium atrogriseum]